MSTACSRMARSSSSVRGAGSGTGRAVPRGSQMAEVIMVACVEVLLGVRTGPVARNAALTILCHTSVLCDSGGVR
jgi:hypothetical protein